MIGPDAGSATGDTGRREVDVSISIRTILVVAAVVAVALALASIGKVLLLIFVSAFSIAVLSPVVDAMERRLRWSRALCATVLVLGIAIVGIGVVLVLLQAIVDGVRNFSDDLPALVEKARHSDLGGLINGESDALGVLEQHTGDITSGLGKASGGLADVGVSAFGVVTLVFSVTFLTLFGLVDEPRVRAAVGSLLYRDNRERYERLTDRIIKTTSRYMLGNLAISVICGTVYGVTAVILGLPHPFALRPDRRNPRSDSEYRGPTRRDHHRNRRPDGKPRDADRLRDRDRRLPADRELRPAADDHRQSGAHIRIHRDRERPGVRVTLRRDRRDHRRADHRRDPDRLGGGHRREKSSIAAADAGQQQPA